MTATFDDMPRHPANVFGILFSDSPPPLPPRANPATLFGILDSNLPHVKVLDTSELLANIIQFLPTKDIVRARRVSKTWLDIIDDTGMKEVQIAKRTASSLPAAVPSAEEIVADFNDLLLRAAAQSDLPQVAGAWFRLGPTSNMHANDVRRDMLITEPPVEEVWVRIALKDTNAVDDGSLVHSTALERVAQTGGVRYKLVKEAFEAAKMKMGGGGWEVVMGHSYVYGLDKHDVAKKEKQNQMAWVAARASRFGRRGRLMVGW